MALTTSEKNGTFIIRMGDFFWLCAMISETNAFCVTLRCFKLGFAPVAGSGEY